MRISFRLALVAVFGMIAIPGNASAQAACSSTVAPSCEVYTDCIEAKCNCNATSYAYVEKFGAKYCKRFLANTGFSAKGREWRDKTLLCLSDAVSRAFVSTSSSTCDCKGIQAAAIKSHTPCYVSSPSFCKLPSDDIRVIAKIVDSGDIVALGLDGTIETALTLFTCMTSEGVAQGTDIALTFLDEKGNIFAGEVALKSAELADSAGLTDVAAAFREIAKRYGNNPG